LGSSGQPTAEETIADMKQTERHEQEELRDLDVPERQAEDAKGGNVAASGTDMRPWTTTHGGTSTGR
jgi:hypothetical protein